MEMMRICKLLTCLYLLCFLLSACGQEDVSISNSGDSPPSSVTPISDWSYQFTDHVGTVVSLDSHPERVAVLFSSYAEIWNLAGGTVSVSVGESIDRGFVPESTPLVDAGAGKAIDLELLLAVQPDFVIGSADIEAQAEICRIMNENGIPSALFQVDTFSDYLSMLKICTDITGNEAAYTEHGILVAQESQEIMTAVEQYLTDSPSEPEILFIRAGSQYSSTKAKRAPDNFVCTMLDDLGAHNIADDAAILLDGLSLEEILLRDPDYIFLTTMGSEDAAKAYISDLFTQNGWSSLDAVQRGNYAFLPKDLFHFKPNARWAEAYSHLAELLYPELNTHD